MKPKCFLLTLFGEKFSKIEFKKKMSILEATKGTGITESYFVKMLKIFEKEGLVIIVKGEIRKRADSVALTEKGDNVQQALREIGRLWV